MRQLEYEERLSELDYYLNLEITWLVIWLIIIMLIVSTIRNKFK